MFKNIDRFAAENLQFHYALSPAPWTSPAMASLFTSTYPSAHGVTQHVSANRMPEDALSRDFTTLAEALNMAGYRTLGITANAWVSAERGYSQGFARFGTLDYASAVDVNKLAFEAIEELRGSPPFFMYLHYMDPHPPLNPPADLLRRFEAELANHPPAHSGADPGYAMLRGVRRTGIDTCAAGSVLNIPGGSSDDLGRDSV